MNDASTNAGAVPGVLDRATVTARRATVQTALLEAMQAVERYKGALALIDELLSLEDPSA